MKDDDDGDDEEQLDLFRPRARLDDVLEQHRLRQGDAWIEDAAQFLVGFGKTVARPFLVEEAVQHAPEDLMRGSRRAWGTVVRCAQKRHWLVQCGTANSRVSLSPRCLWRVP